MTGLVSIVREWGATVRQGVEDPAELARLRVVEALAVRWASVVVARSSSSSERVAASRELRALLGNGAGKAQEARGDVERPGLGVSIGDELAALYGSPVAR